MKGHGRLSGEYYGYGVTLTFKHRGSGRLRCYAGWGRTRQDAVDDCLERFDPAEWRVVCYSTPDTIFRDLQGRARRPDGLAQTSPETALFTRRAAWA